MSVLVFGEQRKGEIRGVTREMLGQATRLAAELGGPVVCVLPAASDPGAASLGEAGADRVLLATHESFGVYAPEGYRAAVLAAVKAAQPDVLLFGATALGKDLAPRVAARLGAGLATDCVALAVQDGQLTATRPVFAGKAVQKVRFPKRPAIVSLRPKVFPPAPQPGKSAAVENLAFELPADAGASRVVELKAAAQAKLDLTEADIIVSGGRAMKGPENFKLLEELADALGAVVGASRAAVDAGWRPHSDQVGQTGKTVSPKLYFAVGISGAIQHLAGMSSSRCVVAINKDPDAPIFKVADYGLVGDLYEVVPALTAEVKKLNAHRN
jgi:electron transfer flavoprotein alpha subunit